MRALVFLLVVASCVAPPQERPSGGELLQNARWSRRNVRVRTLLPAEPILTDRRQVLRRGMRGEAVRRVQEFLQRVGLYDGPIHGVYDEATEEAVRRFQEIFGLKPDGRVGWRTAQAMERVRRGEVR